MEHLSLSESLSQIQCKSINHFRLQVDLSGFIVEALPNDPGQCSLVFVSKVSKEIHISLFKTKYLIRLNNL